MTQSELVLTIGKNRQYLKFKIASTVVTISLIHIGLDIKLKQLLGDIELTNFNSQA